MMTNKVVIYTSKFCPYCERAKSLLKHHGIEYKEISVENQDVKDEMIVLAKGKKTVPQIFIGREHIGGYDELYKLQESNSLEAKLL